MFEENVGPVPAAPVDRRSTLCRRAFLAAYAGAIGSLFVVVPFSDFGIGLAAVFAFLLSQWAAALVWIHRAWSRLPIGERRSSTGADVTAASAVGLLFVPIFNLYWIYVTNLGLAKAWNRVHESTRGVRPVSEGLATTAILLQFVPYLSFLAAPPVWLAFMTAVDRAADEASEPLDIRTLAERFT